MFMNGWWWGCCWGSALLSCTALRTLMRSGIAGIFFLCTIWECSTMWCLFCECLSLVWPCTIGIILLSKTLLFCSSGNGNQNYTSPYSACALLNTTFSLTLSSTELSGSLSGTCKDAIPTGKAMQMSLRIPICCWIWTHSLGIPHLFPIPLNYLCFAEASRKSTLSYPTSYLHCLIDSLIYGYSCGVRQIISFSSWSAFRCSFAWWMIETHFASFRCCPLSIFIINIIIWIIVIINQEFWQKPILIFFICYKTAWDFIIDSWAFRWIHFIFTFTNYPY